METHFNPRLSAPDGDTSSVGLAAGLRSQGLSAVCVPAGDMRLDKGKVRERIWPAEMPATTSIFISLGECLATGTTGGETYSSLKAPHLHTLLQWALCFRAVDEVCDVFSLTFK